MEQFTRDSRVNPAYSFKVGLPDVKRCARFNGYIYNPASSYTTVLACKSRQCPACSTTWAWKWRARLAEQQEWSKRFGTVEPQLALTLTLGQAVDYEQLWRTLKLFWRRLRRSYPDVTYWGVVEFNQSHTIPHLHFLLGGYSHIPYKIIRQCWILAQQGSGILENPAWVVRVEKIRANAAAYFAKYISKIADGGKDEIPRRNLWGGRYVRYSKGFFHLDFQTTLKFLQLARQNETGEYGQKGYIRLGLGLSGWQQFVEKADVDFSMQNEALVSAWVIEYDRSRATVLHESEQLSLF